MVTMVDDVVECWGMGMGWSAEVYGWEVWGVVVKVVVGVGCVGWEVVVMVGWDGCVGWGI